MAGRPIAGLAMCLMAAGCGSLGQALNPTAQGSDVSIAVESIDGPPREVAQRLVGDLTAEAAPRRIAIVGANGEAATYHVRGYLALHAGSAPAIAWAWDVYDASLNRAFRLSGEERAADAASAGGKSWAVADEALLRRIAHAGMDQLAGLMAAPPVPAAPAPAPPATPPGRSGAGTVASRDDVQSQPPGAAFLGTPRLAEAGPRR